MAEAMYILRGVNSPDQSIIPVNDFYDNIVNNQWYFVSQRLADVPFAEVSINALDLTFLFERLHNIYGCTLEMQESMKSPWASKAMLLKVEWVQSGFALNFRRKKSKTFKYLLE